MQLLNRIKKLGRQFLGLFPSALPQGVAEREEWVQSIIDTYDLPTKEVDSIKFALYTMIMHLGPQVAYKAKLYFVLSLKAAVAKQIAGAGFQEIKQRQQAEATAKVVASDVQPKV